MGFKSPEMYDEILFEETQRFKQWWIWLMLIGINGLFLFGIYRQLVEGKPFGDKPMSDTGLLIAYGLMLVITGSFRFMKMETQIKKDGIYVRFFPFHLSFRYYPWNKISKSFIRKYNSILEYGGWGIRMGFSGKGKAFNVSGNTGLQLEFFDNKKLLIGTNKPEVLGAALKKIKHISR